MDAVAIHLESAGIQFYIFLSIVLLLDPLKLIFDIRPNIAPHFTVSP